MKTKPAFTLPTILITMVIITVILMIVLPTFFVNIKAREYRTALQKGINSLARAATANYGTEDYDFSGSNGYYGESGSPISVCNKAGGAEDGYAVFGRDVLSVSDAESHSDLHPYVTSLFHIWKNNLNLRSSKTFGNYTVMPADLALHCVAGETIEVEGGGESDVIVIEGFLGRQYKDESIIQGSGGIISLCKGRSLEDGGINQGRMFMMSDGMVFTYDPAQAYCFDSNPCYGYLDVNGTNGPNRMIACTEGEDKFITIYADNRETGVFDGDCIVKHKDVTDIYPILFYGNSVKPATLAGKYVFDSRVFNKDGIAK